MRRFVAGVVVTLVVIVVAIYFYFARGFAPVATSARAMPFETRLARIALAARIDKEAPRNVPGPADENTYLEGAKTYREYCAVCHGLPGKPLTAIAAGEFPRPPQLLHGKGVTDDPPGETYWKVANGIRMTGMPGFGKSLSTDEMWQVSLLLANADKLPPTVTAALASGRAGQVGPAR